jgi:hypothetical protein
MKKISMYCCCLFAVGAMIVLAMPVQAYPTYSESKVTHPPGSERCDPEDALGCEEAVGYCKACHGNFQATNEDNETPFLRDVYVSPTDGEIWSEIYTSVESGSEPEEEIGLHDVHRHIMVDEDNPRGTLPSRCDVCHDSGGRYPVFLSSDQSDYLGNLGCVGCHGRAEDMGHDTSSSGLGAGLRQHHTNAGVTECKSCHADADPALYTPVGEDVLPPYYFTPDDEFVNKPTNPCNSGGEEDYAGGWQGLDNDGDGAYDIFDGDCPQLVRAEICHVTQRGRWAGRTITITVNGKAVPAHLNHGDTLGECRESLTRK